jgi:hypothetical protein
MRRVCLVLLGVGLWTSPLVQGSSVLQMGLSEILGASELVFEGRVIGTQVRPSPDERRIYTYVTFRVLDVLKGDPPGETVRLRFLGGTWRGLSMKVTDMQIPQLGELGVYFVESTRRLQVNPLFGWDQGHYVVHVDAADGQEKLYTVGMRPITGFVTEPSQASRGLSKGYALGLAVPETTAPGSALTLDEFKAGLRGRLAGGR